MIETCKDNRQEVYGIGDVEYRLLLEEELKLSKYQNPIEVLIAHYELDLRLLNERLEALRKHYRKEVHCKTLCESDEAVESLMTEIRGKLKRKEKKVLNWQNL